MTTITPQQTGSSGSLRSRNPFLPLAAPEPTGSSQTPVSVQDDHPSPPSSSPPTPPPKTQAPKTTPSPENRSAGTLNSRPAAALSSPRISIEDASASPSREFKPPAGPPPRLPPRNTPAGASSPNRPPTPPRNSTLDILTEDLPPHYTPGPNAYEGEQSLDFGPVRPFQDTVRPAWPPMQPAGDYQYSAQSLGSSSGIGTRSGSLRQSLGSLILAALTDPPRASSSSSYQSYDPSPGFLRSAPYGAPNPPQPPPPPAPYGSPQRPVPSLPGDDRWSQYPGLRQRSITPEPQPRIPDDGRPTPRPTPGHPLLRDGKVLVYPVGFECRKCFNKGFRPLHASTFDATPRALAPGDPSHPCKRCWRHHARAYSASLSQLDWNEVVDMNLQRPISDLDVVSRSVLTSEPPGTSRSQSTQPINVRAPPPNFGIGSLGPTGNAGQGPVQWRQDTPTGSVVYEPGDPRIGGRLCPRCHGSGRTRLFILEIETCNLCSGIGRVF